MGRGDGFEPLKAVVMAYGEEFETQPLDEVGLRRVSEMLELPQEFVELYAEHGPAQRSSIPWVVEEMFIFSFDELPEAQAGYRWSGAGRTPLLSWSPTWVVVASIFGDPFLVDTSRDGCPVMFARHGAGTWSPVEVASSMESFIDALVVIEGVLLDGFDLDVWGDDGLLPEFVDEVERGITDVLTGAQAAAFVGLLA